MFEAELIDAKSSKDIGPYLGIGVDWFRNLAPRFEQHFAYAHKMLTKWRPRSPWLPSLPFLHFR